MKMLLTWVFMVATCAFGQDATRTELKDIGHHIFSVTTIGDNVNIDSLTSFVSLSDIYYDSLAVPPRYITHQKSISFDRLELFELEAVYRERLLAGTNLTENDTLFLYDYARNSLEKAPLSRLKAIARLTPYAGEGDEIYVDSYMIGFEIGHNRMRESRRDYYNHVLVAIGSENPFIQQQLHRMEWEAVKEPGIDLQGLNAGALYRYQQDGTTFLVRDVLDTDGGWLSSRKLWVVGADGAVLATEDFRDSEGTSLVPLNFVDENAPDIGGEQWTGKLFKNCPPVAFGFTYHSFGCPSIILLDKSYAAVIIHCDNRH